MIEATTTLTRAGAHMATTDIKTLTLKHAGKPPGTEERMREV